MREASSTAKPTAVTPRQRPGGSERPTAQDAERPSATGADDSEGVRAAPDEKKRRWSREQAAATASAVRVRLAAMTWLIALTAAIVLSLGAMLVALDANTGNALVERVLQLARAIDGPFWKVFEFSTETSSGRPGPPDEVKNHLVNWGLAAAAYLVVGRLISNMIRPGSTPTRR